MLHYNSQSYMVILFFIYPKSLVPAKNRIDNYKSIYQHFIL